MSKDTRPKFTNSIRYKCLIARSETGWVQSLPRDVFQAKAYDTNIFNGLCLVILAKLHLARFMMKHLLQFIHIINFVAHVASQDLHTVSIFSRNDFQVLRPCMHTCLYGNGDVAPGAGCGAPYYNQCWCSSKNIASSATRYISTCISTLCSDNVDVATGIDIYYDYCSKAGFPIPNTVARPVATSVDLHVVSIYSRNDFKVLRPCVTSCLYGGGDVAPGAGCGSPYYNQCWCSSNIVPSATSHISSCITNLCTDDFDISTAVAIYYSYCSEAGHPFAFQAAASTAPLSTAVQTTS